MATCYTRVNKVRDGLVQVACCSPLPALLVYCGCNGYQLCLNTARMPAVNPTTRRTAFDATWLSLSIICRKGWGRQETISRPCGSPTGVDAVCEKRGLWLLLRWTCFLHICTSKAYLVIKTRITMQVDHIMVMSSDCTQKFSIFQKTEKLNSFWVLKVFTYWQW